MKQNFKMYAIIIVIIVVVVIALFKYNSNRVAAGQSSIF